MDMDMDMDMLLLITLLSRDVFMLCSPPKGRVSTQ